MFQKILSILERRISTYYIYKMLDTNFKDLLVNVFIQYRYLKVLELLVFHHLKYPTSEVTAYNSYTKSMH